MIFMLAAALVLVACGDDDETGNTTSQTIAGTYNGSFNEKVAGADYANTTINVVVTKTGTDTYSLALDDFPASPADPSTGRPATMMKSTVITDVQFEPAGNGTYRLVSDELHATGTYNDTPYTYEGTFEGTWSSGRLIFTMSFQIGRMPFPVEATFEGTAQ